MDGYNWMTNRISKEVQRGVQEANEAGSPEEVDRIPLKRPNLR